MAGKTRKYFILIVICSTLLLTIWQPHSHTANLSSGWLGASDTPPTIDGVISDGEWFDSVQNIYYAWPYGTTSSAIAVDMFAFNNAEYLYLGFQWDDSTQGVPGDALYIHFDENNDGDWAYPANRENAIKCAMVEHIFTWIDGYGTTILDSSISEDAGTQDGVASGTWSASEWTIELKIPLDCSALEDLQSEAGDIIGLFILIYKGGYFEYPAGGYAYHNKSSSFELAAEPGLGTPITIVSLLLTIGVIALYMTWKRYKQEYLSV